MLKQLDIHFLHIHMQSFPLAASSVCHPVHKYLLTYIYNNKIQTSSFIYLLNKMYNGRSARPATSLGVHLYDADTFGK